MSRPGCPEPGDAGLSRAPEQPLSRSPAPAPGAEHPRRARGVLDNAPGITLLAEAGMRTGSSATSWGQRCSHTAPRRFSFPLERWAAPPAPGMPRGMFPRKGNPSPGTAAPRATSVDYFSDIPKPQPPFPLPPSTPRAAG